MFKLAAYADSFILQVGTGITNGLINARKAFDKAFAGEAEDVPILSTSVAYGVYMAVSSNLRYVDALISFPCPSNEILFLLIFYYFLNC